MEKDLRYVPSQMLTSWVALGSRLHYINGFQVFTLRNSKKIHITWLTQCIHIYLKGKIYRACSYDVKCTLVFLFYFVQKIEALTKYIKFWDPLIINPQFLLTPALHLLNEMDGL